MDHEGLPEILRRKRFVICVGSGGVGKTTLSATLSLRAALEGRRTAILAIDPARRLGTSLGMTSLGNHPRPIPQELLAAAGLPDDVQLDAMVLDQKRTFDDIVDRHSPSGEAAERLKENRWYQQMAGALVSTGEYLAVEKLLDLHRDGGYDLIVLDTPPTSNALDFLDAPDRLLAVLESTPVKWVDDGARQVGTLGLKLLKTGGHYLVRGLSKVTGAGVIEQILGLLSDLAGLYDGMRERAAAVRELLRSDETAFVLVTGPDDLTLREAVYLNKRLSDGGMPLGGFVVNRVRPPFGWEPGQPMQPDELELSAVAAAWREQLPGVEGSRVEELVQGLGRNLTRYRKLAGLDRRNVDRYLTEISKGCFCHLLPELEEDIHDLAGLAGLGTLLLGPLEAEPKDVAE